MRRDGLEMVIFGAGPVGGSVGGWIAAEYDNIHFLDQGDIAAGMKAKGITLYEGGRKEETTQHVNVNVIDDLAERPDADIIVLAVKNYSLDAVARAVKDKAGDKAIIVALQNGVENQAILPRYFSRVLYGVIGYNAWMDEPGVIGKIASILGEKQINIIDIRAPQDLKAGRSLAVIKTNVEVPRELIEKIKSAIKAIAVFQFSYNP